MKPVLEMRGITKAFPGARANDRVDFTIFPGEIHALLGENGAGKSTLMNILYGLCRPDEGEIRLRGKRVRIGKPIDAIRLGIGMVHQHFMLVPVMTVAENILVGAETTRFLSFIDRNRAKREIRELSSQYGLAADPDAITGELPVGARQRVEILKVLYRKADILIFDEPTAVLTPHETDSLFHTVAALAKSGKSVIFITHKLREVFRTADRITVLRGGRVVGTPATDETSERELVSLMVGRDITLRTGKQPAIPGKPILEVNDLEVDDDRGVTAVKGVSFAVRSGEIAGIAGVQGNGQTELAEALSGLRECQSGTFRIDGREVGNRSPRVIALQGLAHIPEDRHRHGMVESYHIADNLVLNRYFQKPFSDRLVLSKGKIGENAEHLMKDFDIRAPGIFSKAGGLSGGNQQKVVIAREFSRDVKLLIANQPTRGLDVGSMEFIHRKIIEKRDAGCAVLLISTELDEVLSLSDRLFVMYKGRIVAETDTAGANRKTVGLWMAGLV